MLQKKSNKITATGIFNCNLMVINDCTLRWIEAKEFNLADLAKLIGIDEGHRVKAKITLEVVEEPCELCGKLISGDKLCTECAKIVCDECAKMDIGGRYCPICFDLQKSPQKIA